MKFADFASRHRYAIDCPDAGLDARQQDSDRLIAARRIEAHPGYSGRTFGDAVTIGKRQAELLFDARLQIEIERSPGHRDQTQRSAVELPETCHCLVFQQALVGRGHAVKNGDPLFGDRLGERRGIIFADQANGAADHQGHDQERDADDMRDRQHDIYLVVRVHLTEMRRGLGADKQIIVGEHHPLWRARRSRGVDQHRNLLRRIALNRLGHGAFVQRADIDLLEWAELPSLRPAARGVSRRFLRHFRDEKHPPRAAVIADLVQFARRQSRIGDDRPRIDPARRQQQRRKRDTVFADDDHPVARPDAERFKASSDIRNRAIQFAVAPGDAVFDQRNAVARFGNVLVNDLMDAARKPGVDPGEINRFRQFRHG